MILFVQLNLFAQYQWVQVKFWAICVWKVTHIYQKIRKKFHISFNFHAHIRVRSRSLSRSSTMCGACMYIYIYICTNHIGSCWFFAQHIITAWLNHITIHCRIWRHSNRHNSIDEKLSVSLIFVFNKTNYAHSMKCMLRLESPKNDEKIARKHAWMERKRKKIVRLQSSAAYIQLIWFQTWFMKDFWFVRYVPLTHIKSHSFHIFCVSLSLSLFFRLLFCMCFKFNSDLNVIHDVSEFMRERRM